MNYELINDRHYLKELLNRGLYKQLSQIILERQEALLEGYVFTQIGLLREYLSQGMQGEDDLLPILFMMERSRWPNKKGMIEDQLDKIQGIKTVYETILQRQTDQAKSNQYQLNLIVMRKQDKEDIDNIQRILNGPIAKIITMLKLALFSQHSGLQ